MSQLAGSLSAHWFAAVLLGVGVALAAPLALRWRRGGALVTALALLAPGCALLGLGGLFLPSDYAPWVAIGAAVLLFGMVFVVMLTGYWWRPLAAVVGGLLALGVGGLAADLAQIGVTEAAVFLANMRPMHPWWLLLLLLVPVIILLSFRSLAGLGPVRRWVAIGLRCLLVIFLTLALAETASTFQPEFTTVVFVADGSLSVEDMRPRVETLLNDVVRLRGQGRQDYKHALVLFGKTARTERPPSNAPDLNFRFQEVGDSLDGSYTNIEAALKMALASFPEGAGKRIVLLSDGNENLGHAEEQARLAKEMGVQIDVVPLATGRRRENEVLVQAIEAPHQTGRGSNLPIRVLVRSYNPNVVVGTLSVNQIKYKAWYEVTDAVLDNLTLDGVPADTRERLAALKGQKFYSDREWFNALVKAVGRKDLAQFGQKLMARSKHEGFSKPVPDSPRQVELQPGLNAFTFRQVLDDDKAGQDSFTYRAEFQPLFVKDGKTGRVLAKGLPGDRVENNRAFTHVVARGQRRVLLIEQPPKPGQPREHELLEQRLAEAGGGQKFKVDVLTTEKLPKDKDRLAVILSNYDCVILANVPADQVSETQQELIRSNTHDQGCGLVMIGGPDSFGAGGWQKTPVEKALPVDCDIKSLKVTGKGGLVLIMHASEMADGNFWQKKIAKLAVEKLAPRDELGVIHFDWGLNKWHIPLQEVGEKRGFFYGQIDRMTPGDMPEVDSALQMAYNSLMEPARELSTRHIIFISDGDPQQQNKNLLAQMRKDKVTVTTVGVATHGAPQDQALLSIATATGGRFHNVRNPAMLPQIYIQETRLVSQSFVYESKNGFPPVLSPRPGPTDGLPRQLPKLYGFVRTTPKPSALVETPIMTPQFAEQDFPLLAYWHYGLGKGVAFTSDARKAWDRDWAASPIFSKFWEGVIDWSLRPVESKRLAMTTEVKDGRVLVRVDARKDGPQGPGTGGPDMGLTLRGYVTFPGAKPGEGRPLTFRQTAPGQYEAEFKSDEAGSYFIDAASVKPQKVKGKDGRAAEQDVVLDSVRAGVTIPYSPEFADLEANTALLEKLRELTDGRSYADEERELAEAAAAVKRAEGRDEKAKAEAEQERLAKAMAEAMFRPGLRQAKSLQNLWHWLVFATAVLLLFDVAVRRISVDPVEVAAKAQAVWDRVRGRPVAVPQTAEFLDRLRTRKAQVGETIGKAARRYEGGDMPAGPVPTAADDLPATPSGPRPTSRPASLAPGQPGSEEPEDFASRLMKAKRRAMQDREKRKDNE